MTLTRWGQAVESNGILVRIEACHSLLDSLQPSTDVDGARELRRIRQVCQLTQDYTEGRRAEVVPPDTLPNIAQTLQNINNSLQPIKDNAEAGSAPGIQDLRNINDGPVNDLVQCLARIPRPPYRAQGVEAILAGLEADSHQQLARLEADVRQVAEGTESTRTDFENRATEVEQALAGMKQDAQSFVDAAKADFANQVGQSVQAVTDIQNRGETLLTTQQTNFSQLLTDNGEKLSEMLRTSRDQLDAATQRLDATMEAQLSEVSTRLQTELDDIADKKAEAEKLLGIIGMTGLIHGYQSSANSERKAGFWWRILTVLFGSAAVGFLVWAAVHSVQTSPTWLTFTTKAAVAAAFGTLAAYSGRVAGQHYRRAARYRNYELALASLNSYVEPLSDDKRQALLEQLSPGFFGKLDEGSNGSEDWPTQMNQVLGLLQEVVSRLPK